MAWLGRHVRPGAVWRGSDNLRYHVVERLKVAVHVVKRDEQKKNVEQTGGTSALWEWQAGYGHWEGRSRAQARLRTRCRGRRTQGGRRRGQRGRPWWRLRAGKRRGDKATRREEGNKEGVTHKERTGRVREQTDGRKGDTHTRTQERNKRTANPDDPDGKEGKEGEPIENKNTQKGGNLRGSASLGTKP